MSGQPFLLSYGGGHARIVEAIARALHDRAQPYDLLGLTTAKASFLRAGLEPLDLAQLARANPLSQKPLLFTQTIRSGHPDISDDEAAAYHYVGFSDLVYRVGQQEAAARYAEHGRKAFEPVAWFKALFDQLRPSVLVTTTSPRFELAAIKAAHAASIPSVAVGDMYLIAEQEWILAEPYADHLTVISEDIGQMLQATGRLRSRCHILGNPAFDELAARDEDDQCRMRTRETLSFGGRKCILWPLGGADELVAGRRLLRFAEVVSFLENVCVADPSWTYVIRPHPNWPVDGQQLPHGRVDNELTLREVLLAADLVCVEASTVGLQAVLMGRPTICHNFADYVLYPGFGWASKSDSLDELRELILSRRYRMPPAELRAQVGGATAAVCDLIVQAAAERGTMLNV